MTFAASRRVYAPLSARLLISHAETSPVMSIIHLFLPSGIASVAQLFCWLLVKRLHVLH